MNVKHLIFRNIFRYKSFYRLIAVAVIVAVAVITGSLVVGDSVRSTLVKRVAERLGKTETIIFSRYSYLNDDIVDSLRTGRGVLLLNGFVSVSGKLIPVMVWGRDDLEIKKGQAKINTALFNEINNAEIKNIVLRLPAAGMVPLGSMFVTDTYTTSLRLELNDVVPIEHGGNINLKNEQTIPFNIFVNREELAEAMDVPGKINLILSDEIISKEDFAAVWNYRISGLNVNPSRHSALDAESPVVVISDRIFIQDKIVETLCAQDPTTNRIYAYLANGINNSQLSILNSQLSILYSFITAVDFYDGQKLQPDEIILSNYAAKRLNVKLGDSISVSYFVSRQFKTLVEDTVFLKVGKIAPLAALQADKTLVAEFPGLSNVERCTDWNSDLPVNMNLISDEDEEYWRKYKNTPKAILPYSTLAPRWENAYGSATALQINDTGRLNALTPEMFDIQLIYPRETGITAAKSGVDFASLFLSLGFFIIISAAMLMLVPLSEMLFRRRDELQLLKATGFPQKRIFRLLWREAAPVVCFSAIIGIIAGLAYTYLVLFLLGNVWKGATHTEGFSVYPNLLTIGAGLLAGIIFSMLLLYLRISRFKVQGLKFKVQSLRFKILNSQLSILNSLFVGLLLLNIFFLKSSLLFICTGIVFLFTAWAWLDYLMNKQVKRQLFDTPKLMWASLFFAKKQAMLSFITLASGVFIVFSVGLNRQGFADSSQIRTATGGFSLWGETSVPVYHNIQTEEGRAKLALKDLPSEAHAIQLLKYSADEASCLNLNKVVTPNVLGIDMDELARSDFKISDVRYAISDMRHATRDNSVGEVANRKSQIGVIPALVDETVLVWSLGKKLGDTLVYVGEKGKTVSIVLAGTLQNSIFQGAILIDKSLFREIWSEISGSEVMLVKVPDAAIDETKMLLSQALNNYGVRIMTTGERLQLFHSVTDTYLTIFLTLGGLGLLLGIFSFIIVVRKNIVARMKKISLYRSLGFDEKRMFSLLYKENIIIPLCAILTGAAGSLLGISMGFGNVSLWVWTMVIIFLLIFIFSVTLFVKISVRNYLGKMRG